MLRPRSQSLPPLPPGLDAYRPAEVLGTRVLVVDDEAAILRQFQIDLDDLGYQSRTAATVEDARRALTAERMGAVLLDLVLDEDEDSGFKLLAWIRQHQPGLPVIVLSAAQVSSAAIRRAFETGASSYFVKGNVPMAHIYSDLAARLIERAGARAGTYSFGNLSFDPTRRTLTLEDRSVRLTSQQTALIVHLAQAARPATAADLIGAGIFRPDAARSTVHSSLLTLRRKLDDLEAGLGAKLLLSTPRGYSLGNVG